LLIVLIALESSW